MTMAEGRGHVEGISYRQLQRAVGISARDAIYYDELEGVAGREYPVGSPEQPVNNEADLRYICADRKSNKIFVKGKLTLTLPTEGFVFQGVNISVSEVAVGSISIDSTSFKDLILSGASTGTFLADRCIIELIGLNGNLLGCLVGISKASGFTDFIGSYVYNDVDADNNILNFSGTIFQEVTLSNILRVELYGCSGTVELKDITADTSNIGLQSGALTIDASCTGGIINLYGDMVIENHSVGSVVNDFRVKREYSDGFVYYDDVSGVAGTSYPIGTPALPVNNEADLRAICTARGIKRVFVTGTLIITMNMEGFDIRGASLALSSINVAFASIDGSCFKDIGVNGNATGVIFAEKCGVSGLWGAEGQFTDCFASNFICGGIPVFGGGYHNGDFDAAGNDILFYNCFFENVFIYNAVNVVVFGCSGIFEVRDIAAGDSHIELLSGVLTIFNTCVGGTINLYGNFVLINNAGAGCTVNDYRIQKEYSNDTVYFDSIGGEAGTAYPVGTATRPVNNEANLRAILIARDLRKVVLVNPTTVLQFTSALTGIDFIGEGVIGLTPTINFNGQAIGCTFSNLRITDTTGTNLVSVSEFSNCNILTVIAHTVGGSNYHGCRFANAIANPPLGIINLYDDCIMLGDFSNTTGTIRSYGDLSVCHTFSNTTGSIDIDGNLHVSLDFSSTTGDISIGGDCLIGGSLSVTGGHLTIRGNCRTSNSFTNSNNCQIIVAGNCQVGGFLTMSGAGTWAIYGTCNISRSITNTGFLNMYGDCSVGQLITNSKSITYSAIRLVSSNPTLDLGLSATSVTERIISRGSLIVAKMAAGATAIIDLCGGTLTIAATCTGGTITLCGDCKVTDLAGGAVTVNDHRVNLQNTRFFQEAVAATDVNGVTWKDLLVRNAITKPVRICGFMVTKGAGWAGDAKIRIVDGVGTTKIFPFQTEYVEGTDFTSAVQVVFNFPVEVSMSKGFRFQFSSSNAADGAGETLALNNLDVQELS